jgi:4-hydroxybenzoate polyprenyltransferase
MHPKNRIRPIASGQFPLGNILPLIFFLTVVLIILLWNSRIIWPVLVYLIINLGYSLGSKSIPVLDILIISAGFILRVWAGALASHVPLSYWLILMTILSSCFLALGKRKAELEMQVENIINLRPSLTFYKLKWINPGMKIIAVISCGAYVLYCISGAVMTRFGNRHIYFTAIFVILGFIRYYRVTSGKYVYSDPTDLVWHDHLMQFILVGWITCFYLLIY